MFKYFRNSKISRYLKYLKHLRLYYPEKNKLLVYDLDCSEVMKVILFPEREFTVLPVRGEWLSIHPELILRAMYYYLIKKLGARLSYDLAFINCAKPELVVTFIDNNQTFHKLAQYYKAPFICVQNGMRSHNCAKTFDNIPTLFCFGQRDIDLYLEHKVHLNDVFPVGSLRSSYFLSQVAPGLTNEPSYDICLISEYISGMENSDYQAEGEPLQILSGWLYFLSEYLKKYLAGKKLRVVIAGRQPKDNSAGEIEYYKKYFGDSIEVFPSNHTYLNSYRLAYKSSIVLSYFSTLGGEALSWGKKVLFYPHPRDKNAMIDNPSSWFFKTETESYEEFEKKMDSLLSMSEEQYKSETQTDRAYLMSNCTDTHQVIKKYIDKILGS